MNKKIVIVSAALAGLLFLNACNSGTTTAEQKDSTTGPSKDTTTAMQKTEEGMMQPMNSMMDRMKGIALTGDIDNDFAMLMMEHHQGAVDISEMEAAKGSIR